MIIVAEFCVSQKECIPGGFELLLAVKTMNSNNLKGKILFIARMVSSPWPNSSRPKSQWMQLWNAGHLHTTTSDTELQRRRDNWLFAKLSDSLGSAWSGNP